MPSVISRLPPGLQAGKAQYSWLPWYWRVQVSSWQLPAVVRRASSVTKGRAAQAGRAHQSPRRRMAHFMKGHSRRALLRPCFKFTTAVVLLTLLGSAQAQSESPSFKLTVGRYQSSAEGQASSFSTDVNLRHSSTLGNVWYGHYIASAEELTQDRVGWDRNVSLGAVRVLPSLQLATGGAWNGSLNLETGQTWYA